MAGAKKSQYTIKMKHDIVSRTLATRLCIQMTQPFYSKPRRTCSIRSILSPFTRSILSMFAPSLSVWS